MKLECKHCGEEFQLTKEELSLWEAGEIPKPDTCWECFEMINQPPEPDYYSDADPGL